jgi:hypothetical protein
MALASLSRRRESRRTIWILAAEYWAGNGTVLPNEWNFRTVDGCSTKGAWLFGSTQKSGAREYGNFLLT